MGEMPLAQDPRATMVEIGQLLYERFLTNSGGGNISCRVGERIYITPRGLGSKHRWRLTEEMVLVFDGDLNPLEGDPNQVSREGKMHFAPRQTTSQISLRISKKDWFILGAHSHSAGFRDGRSVASCS